MGPHAGPQHEQVHCAKKAPQGQDRVPDPSPSFCVFKAYTLVVAEVCTPPPPPILILGPQFPFFKAHKHCEVSLSRKILKLTQRRSVAVLFLQRLVVWKASGTLV